MVPETCRMARAGLALGVRELAQLASVSTQTVTRFEAGAELKPRTILALQAALEAAGADFLMDDGHGPGVRLRPGARASSDVRSGDH
ncbi:transcriptional regulator [Methylobacterium fujisawaense]|nr:transcriptional regulator [Methylobacterium fujisawaense]MDH3031057.1 transcriptional regulator [Methylobacterium fujisawaense]